MKYGKKNHVNLNPLSYNIFLLGESKIGKTWLIKNVCQQLAGDDGYLFLELGQERGADAIEGINYVNCPYWDQPYDELTNSIGFADIVDDIVANKNSDYADLQVVVWDTYDQLITMAEQKTIALHNRTHSDKQVDTINGAFGGYGKGMDKALELMLNKMAELRSVGVATIVIGHVKNKDVTDVTSGETYQVLTSDQTQKYFKAIQKNMHFMGLAYIDRDIVKEKTGKKITLDNGKKVDETIGRIQGESRRIKFRDDSYCLDCGGRFADIVSDIPLDPDEFIKAINDAILAEQSKSGISLEQTKKDQAKADTALNKRIAETEVKNRNENLIRSKVEKVVSFIKSNGAGKPDLLKEIMACCQEYGFSDPSKITTVECAEALEKIIEQYK